MRGRSERKKFQRKRRGGTRKGAMGRQSERQRRRRRCHGIDGETKRGIQAMVVRDLHGGQGREARKLCRIRRKQALAMAMKAPFQEAALHRTMIKTKMLQI